MAESTQRRADAAPQRKWTNGSSAAANARSTRARGRATRRVVVVGSRTALRDAVTHRLEASGLEVHAAARGDDLICALSRADAVVVVDVAGFRVTSRSYSATLRAIAGVILGSNTCKTVVCVDYGPGGEHVRKVWEWRTDKAQAELRDAGTPVVVLRPTLLVGTPKVRAPHERALFARPARLSLWRTPRLYLPRTGSQKVTPICIEDFAAVVDRAVHRPEEFDEKAATVVAGPKQMSLDGLVDALNGANQPKTHVPAPVLNLLRPRKRFLPSAGAEAVPEPSQPRAWGVPLRTVQQAWPEGAVKARNRSWYSALGLSRTYWYRSKALFGLLVPCILLVGLFALAVGLRDFVVVPELGPRLTSLTVALTGAFLVAAAILPLTRWPGRYAVGFMAGCVITLFGASLLGATIQSHGPSGWRWVWIAMIVVGLLTVATMRRRAGTQLVHALRSGHLKFLTSIVSVGALIGLAQWWYTTQYVPPSHLPTLEMSAKLTKVGVADGRVIAQVDLVAKNQSDKPINVVASQYEIFAAGVTRRGQVGPDELVHVGTPVMSGSYIGPGETVASSSVALLAGRYDVATLHFVVATSRRKLLFDREQSEDRQLSFEHAKAGRTGRQKFTPAPSPAQLTTSVRTVDEPALLREVTRGDRVVVTRTSRTDRGLRDGCPLSSHLDVSIDRRSRKPDRAASRGCDDYNDQMAGYYGLVASDTRSMLDLR